MHTLYSNQLAYDSKNTLPVEMEHTGDRPFSFCEQRAISNKRNST